MGSWSRYHKPDRDRELLRLATSTAASIVRNGSIAVWLRYSTATSALHPTGRQSAHHALLENRDQDADRNDGDDQRRRDERPGERELALVERDAHRQRAHADAVHHGQRQQELDPCVSEGEDRRGDHAPRL